VDKCTLATRYSTPRMLRSRCTCAHLSKLVRLSQLVMYDACHQLENRHTNFFRADVEGGSHGHHWGVNDCGHWEDAGVMCYRNPSVDVVFRQSVASVTTTSTTVIKNGSLANCSQFCFESAALRRPLAAAEDLVIELHPTPTPIVYTITVEYKSPYLDGPFV
jgi:hypothetical protein